MESVQYLRLDEVLHRQSVLRLRWQQLPVAQDVFAQRRFAGYKDVQHWPTH